MSNGDENASSGPSDDDAPASSDGEREPTIAELDALEALWFAKEEIALGSVSILALVAIAGGLVIATGVVALPGDGSATMSLAVGAAAILIGLTATLVVWTSWGPTAGAE